MENSVLYSRELGTVGNDYFMETYRSLRNVLQYLCFLNGWNSPLTGSHNMKTHYGESWAHRGSIKQLVMYKKRATLQLKDFVLKLAWSVYFLWEWNYPLWVGLDIYETEWWKLLHHLVLVLFLSLLTYFCNMLEVVNCSFKCSIWFHIGPVNSHAKFLH